MDEQGEEEMRGIKVRRAPDKVRVAFQAGLEVPLQVLVFCSDKTPCSSSSTLTTQYVLRDEARLRAWLTRERVTREDPSQRLNGFRRGWMRTDDLEGLVAP